jgi:hypothetical protein
MTDLNTTDQCMICYEELKDNITTQSCGHSVHKVCLDKWHETSPTCPYCRVVDPTKKIEPDMRPNDYNNLILHFSLVSILYHAGYIIDDELPPNIIIRISSPSGNFLLPVHIIAYQHDVMNISPPFTVFTFSGRSIDVTSI